MPAGKSTISFIDTNFTERAHYDKWIKNGAKPEQLPEKPSFTHMVMIGGRGAGAPKVMGHKAIG